MKGKVRKSTWKRLLSFMLISVMAFSQILPASAVVVETEIEGGGLPKGNVVKEVENLTRSGGTAVVGDVLEYTMTVSNDEAFSTWKNVKLFDTLPTGIDFDSASGVTIDGVASQYRYNNQNRELIVSLGDLAGDDETMSGVITTKDIVVVKFKAVVNESAYNTTIYNSVYVEGDDGTPGEDTDDGITVESDTPKPAMTKAVENVTTGVNDRANAGDVLKYTITLSNNQANSTWKNVVLTDKVPAGVDFNSSSKIYVNGVDTPYTYNATTRDISISLGNIEGGNSAGVGKDIKVVTFEVTVNEDRTGQNVVNTAVANGENGDTDASDDGVDVVSSNPSPKMEKKATNVTTGVDGEAIVGDTLEYTITLSNEEPNTEWKNVVVTDVLPEGIDFNSATGVKINGVSTTNYTYNQGTRTLVVPVGNINGGKSDGTEKATIIVTFYVTVNEKAYGQTVVNTAIGRGDNGEIEVPDNGTDVVSDTPQPSIVKTSRNITSNTPGKAVVGDTLEYKITLANAKPNSVWKNVVVTDALPIGVDFNAGAGVKVNGTTVTNFTYNAATRTLTIPAGDIQGGNSAGVGKDTVVITFNVTVNESAYETTVTNTAVARGDEGEVSDSDDGVEVISKTPNGKGTKSVTNMTGNIPGKARVGDILEYTITIENQQPNSVWKNVVVSDPLPSGVDFNSATGVKVNGVATSNYTYNAATRTLAINLGDLQGGSSTGAGKDVKVITFRVTINESAAGTQITNIAYVDGKEIPPEPGPDVETDEPQPNMSKTALNLSNRPAGTAEARDIIEYSITVKNDMINSEWKSVVVTDTMPTGVDFNSRLGVKVNGATVTNFTYNAATRELTIPLGNIRGGDSQGKNKDVKVITFYAVVNESAYGTTIVNRAVGTGSNGTTNAEDDGIEVPSKTPIPEALKTVRNVTSGAVGTAKVGDILEYKITVQNKQSHSIWRNVVITDPLPEGLDFNSNTGVKINGTATTNYTYNAATRTLTVNLGNINGGDSTGAGKDVKAVTFEVTINEDAYGQTITNVADVSGEEAKVDPGTDVEENSPIPSLNKVVTNTTPGRTDAVVGSILEYVITATNNQPNSEWKNVVITDALPNGLDFNNNTGVKINGAATTNYTYNSLTRTLTVPIGTIQGGDAIVITFYATVNEDAYKTTIQNTAIGRGDNGETDDTDDGINVVSDEVIKTATKVSENLSRESKKAQVGDLIRYTITARNDQPYSTWENVYINDPLPVEVDFDPTVPVTINGKVVPYTYNPTTRVLVVKIGDIEGGKADGTGKTEYVTVFGTIVNENGSNKIFKNVANVDTLGLRKLSARAFFGPISDRQGVTAMDKGIEVEDMSKLRSKLKNK
jgi:fimbrial isopeptide formation D2 family protein